MRTPSPLPPDLLRAAVRQEGLLSSEQCDAAGVTSRRRDALRRAGVLVPVVRGVHDAGSVLPPAPGGDPRRVGWGVERPGDVAQHDAAVRYHRRAPRTRRLGPQSAEAGLELDRGPDHLRRRAAWLALLALGADRAVATGVCALALHGVQGLPLRIRPEAALPDGSHRRPGGGIAVRCFEPGLVVRVRGARACTVEHALAGAVCGLQRDAAVAVLDSAIHLGLMAADGLTRVRSLARGRPGCRRAEPWWDLVDGRSESPLETRARLQCGDVGVPPDTLQVPVRDADGRVVARGDLGWTLPGGRQLVVEIDGAGPHGTPQALYRDRSRQNAVLATGALLLRFTAADVDRGAVARAVRHHLPPVDARTPAPGWGTVGRREGA